MSPPTDLPFADETHAGPAVRPWLVLVVDDDPEVHAVTRLALGDFEFDGRPIQIIDAASAAEARDLLSTTDDIALVLLDVVMETEHAGLSLVYFIREELGNHMTRIVLRTGQPGQAPAREVVTRYEIDDYRTKTELTYERLFTLVMTSLRTYRLLREMQEQQAQLTRSNRELESFAYVASHDLQTPLRGVIGFAQLLESRYADRLDDEGRELLRYIVNGGRDLRTVINDLLEFSRVGRVHSELAPVDLQATLDAVRQQLRGTIEPRGAEVTGTGLPTIQANAIQMEQLFRNLIDNGLKFQPGERPRVEVSAQRLDDGRCELRFRDQGIGIEPEQQERVFELFRRLHPADRFPGTGIGLAICKKIAEFHGGSIRVESAPGAGSTFIVTLPAR